MGNTIDNPTNNISDNKLDDIIDSTINYLSDSTIDSSICITSDSTANSPVNYLPDNESNVLNKSFNNPFDDPMKHPINTINTVKPKIIELGLKNPLSNGQWNKKKGVNKMMQRFTHLQTQSYLRRVNIPKPERVIDIFNDDEVILFM